MRAKSNRVREGNGRTFQGRRKGKEKNFCFVVVQFELIVWMRPVAYRSLVMLGVGPRCKVLDDNSFSAY